MSAPRENLAALRQLMHEENLDAYLIPNTDPHQSEYLPEHWRIIPWISGFTGSSANVVITMEEAGLWTDSRYFIQAAEQLQGSGIYMHKLGIPHTPGFADWTAENLPKGARIGMDDRLYSIAMAKYLEEKFSKKGLELVRGKDLVSPIWTDRPPMPQGKAFEHDIEFAGRSVADKLRDIREEMDKAKANHYIITALDDIAWTFNIRGNDVAFNPVVIAFGIVGEKTASLFIDEGKLDESLKASLGESGVNIFPYEEIQSALGSFSANDSLIFSASHMNASLRNRIADEVKIIEQLSIATMLKSLKNETEQALIRQVMVKDGVAMVKFFMWLEENLGKETITELSAAKQLHAFRKEGEHFVGDSFDTISGYAGHGAIVHYSVNEETDVPLQAEGLYLLDSGGQYLDGTTDITRTVALGEPTPEQKSDFTLVLKGHIQLAMRIYPKNTPGYRLEAFARHALWEQGFDYGHGTGHGVGFFLNVHEGPQTLGTAARGDLKSALQPGMLTSNEPGIYREGQYGIRTENLVLTVKHLETEFGEFYRFDTVTLCPIDSSLVDASLMLPSEIEWYNSYHKEVFDKLSPHLNEEQATWLREKTKAI